MSVDKNGNLINNTGFLKAERNLLRQNGWRYRYDSQRGVGMWYPSELTGSEKSKLDYALRHLSGSSGEN